MIWDFIKNYFFTCDDRLHLFGRTDTGKRRPHNEDSFCILPDHNLMMVADGMGGHNAGEVASSKSIELMARQLSTGVLKKAAGNRIEIQHILTQSLRKTNNAIIKLAHDNDSHAGMGCTFIVGFVCRKNLYTCHVGDVRGYIIKKELIEQITSDHSYAAEFEKKKTDNPNFDQTIKVPAKNIVSRAIGFPFHQDPECHTRQVKQGDRILLCSDGLWAMVNDEDIADIINNAQTPEEACDILIERANNAGGRDNITAVVAFI